MTLPATKSAPERGARHTGARLAEEGEPASRGTHRLSSGPAPKLPALEDDRELLEGFRRGDTAALTKVFRAYVHDVMGTLRGGVTVKGEDGPVRIASQLSEYDLENLMQETFARAFAPQARAAYDGLRPYGAYLATIARNLLVDRARKRSREAKRFVLTDDVDIAGQGEAPIKDPAEMLEEKELGDILARFKAALEEADRRVFVIRYERQVPLRAAATELGIGIYELRRRDAWLRLQLLETLRASGFLQTARIRVGDSVLRRGRREDEEVDA